jgi:hypothetical protein
MVSVGVGELGRDVAVGDLGMGDFGKLGEVDRGVIVGDLTCGCG